jgi:methionine--tRNA ligase beta chain
VSIEEVNRIDVRVGTIESVTDVAGSEKLVELSVSFGDHTRQVLVGMKQERQDPREVIGRQALFVVNLAPRRMAGRLSEAMLFDIGHADGLVPALAVPERPVPPGTRAG